ARQIAGSARLSLRLLQRARDGESAARLRPRVHVRGRHERPAHGPARAAADHGPVTRRLARLRVARASGSEPPRAPACASPPAHSHGRLCRAPGHPGALMPIEILHILGSAEPEGTGVARLVATLAAGLDHRAYRAHACFLGAGGPLASELTRSGMSVTA